MVKIVIQNQACETVINNVQAEDLDFWKELLHHALLRNEVQIVETQPEHNRHQAA